MYIIYIYVYIHTEYHKMIASLLWGDCGDLANPGFHPKTLGVNSNPTNCRIWRGSYLYIYTLSYVYIHIYIYVCMYVCMHVCDMYNIYIYV